MTGLALWFFLAFTATRTGRAIYRWFLEQAYGEMSDETWDAILGAAYEAKAAVRRPNPYVSRGGHRGSTGPAPKMPMTAVPRSAVPASTRAEE